MLKKESTGFIFNVAVLFLIAALFRVAALFQVPIVNVDGILYVQQARAIYYQPQNIFASYEYLTNYALLIAGVYHFIGNWVLAAQIVSLIFSVLTVIPFYFLNLNCWDENRAWFLTLVYAVSPAFVTLSPTIIRGPEFWFFYVSGLWAFSLYLEKKHYLPLMTALFAMLMAVWSRAEGAWPLLLMVGWCLFENRRPKHWHRLTAGVLSAVFFVGFFLLITSSLGIDFINEIYSGVSHRICYSVNRFASLKEVLRQMADTPPSGVVSSFFVHIKRFLWLLAVGVTGRSILKAFSLPVIGIWLAGIFCARKIEPSLKENRTPAAAGFLCVLLVGGLVLLYGQVLLNWSSATRFSALVYFPGLVLFGKFLPPLVFYLGKWLRLRTFRSYIVLALLVLSFSIPGALREGHGKNRVPLKELGLALAEKRQPGKVLKLWGTIRSLRDVHFYAHLLEPAAPSVWQECRVLQPSELTADVIRQASFDYLLVVEADGSRQRLLQLQAVNPDLALTTILETSSGKYGLVSLLKRDVSTVH